MPEAGNGGGPTLALRTSLLIMTAEASISSRAHPTVNTNPAHFKAQSCNAAGVCVEHRLELLDGYHREFSAIQNLGIDYLAHLLKPLASSSAVTTREANRKIPHTCPSPWDQEDPDETIQQLRELDETEEKLYAAMVEDEEDACAERYKSSGVVYKNMKERHADSPESNRLAFKFRHYEKVFRRRIYHKYFPEDKKTEPPSGHGHIVDDGIAAAEKFVVKESREPPFKKYEELPGITCKRRRHFTENLDLSKKHPSQAHQ